jgi:hypothetical protein
MDFKIDGFEEALDPSDIVTTDFNPLTTTQRQ